MKTLTTVLAAAIVAFTAPAFATTHKEAHDMKAGADCGAQAMEKKLAGAAKNSFMKKCETDMKALDNPAKAACDTQAAEKKLAGAAKNSFVKKCVSDTAKMPA